MGDLFLVRESDGACFIFTHNGDRTWLASRVPPIYASKDNNKICYTNRGWVMQDKGMFGAYSKMLPDPGEKQKRSFPPLCTWHNADGTTPHKLTDAEPIIEDAEVDETIRFPFITVSVTGNGFIYRMEVEIFCEEVTPDAFDQMLAEVKVVLQRISKRPRSSLFVMSRVTNPPTLGMRLVNRFISWAGDVGPLLYVTMRGHAIILDPKSVPGKAFMSIISFVQRVLPPPWPDIITPSVEIGEEFLRPLRQVEEDCILRRKVGNGEKSLGISGMSSPTSSVPVTPHNQGEVLETIVPGSRRSAPKRSSWWQRCGCCRRKQETRTSSHLSELVEVEVVNDDQAASPAELWQNNPDDDADLDEEECGNSRFGCCNGASPARQMSVPEGRSGRRERTPPPLMSFDDPTSEDRPFGDATDEPRKDSLTSCMGCSTGCGR